MVVDLKQINMTTILLKISMLGLVVVALLATIANMPDATPLPSGFRTLIEFLFNAMYIVDPVVNVPVFFIVVFNCVEAFLYYLILRGVIIGVSWMFNAS